MSRVFGACKALMTAAKTATPKAPPAVKKTTTKAAESKSKSAKPLGIQKPLPVSAAMTSFLGVPEASRVHATKKIWEYIKLNNLQNPENKREIFCDEKLKTIFAGKDKVGFLEIAKLLSTHFVKNT